MLRDIDLNEISDGRLYTANDMVKADCMGCQGCASCCQGMEIPLFWTRMICTGYAWGLRPRLRLFLLLLWNLVS